MVIVCQVIYATYIKYSEIVGSVEESLNLDNLVHSPVTQEES